MSNLSLDDWWYKQTVHPTCKGEYWSKQQCSLEELNDWIKKRNNKWDAQTEHEQRCLPFNWSELDSER